MCVEGSGRCMNQNKTLVNQEMLDLMKPGSVCVDLAAANGGNVAQTEPDKIVTTDNGVKIVGYSDLPSRLSSTASNLVSQCSILIINSFQIYFVTFFGKMCLYSLETTSRSSF